MVKVNPVIIASPYHYDKSMLPFEVTISGKPWTINQICEITDGETVETTQDGAEVPSPTGKQLVNLKVHDCSNGSDSTYSAF